MDLDRSRSTRDQCRTCSGRWWPWPARWVALHPFPLRGSVPRPILWVAARPGGPPAARLGALTKYGQFRTPSMKQPVGVHQHMQAACSLCTGSSVSWPAPAGLRQHPVRGVRPALGHGHAGAQAVRPHLRAAQVGHGGASVVVVVSAAQTGPRLLHFTGTTRFASFHTVSYTS